MNTVWISGLGGGSSSRTLQLNQPLHQSKGLSTRAHPKSSIYSGPAEKEGPTKDTADLPSEVRTRVAQH